MKKQLLLSLLIGIGYFVCAQPRPVLLDPAKAKDTTYNSIFDETEFIPLETSRQSVFGVVQQLVVTNQYFIILDTDTDAVLFFTKTGKFIAKYKNKHKRYRIQFIQPDTCANTLLIFSQNRNYNIKAATLYAFLTKKPVKTIPLVTATRLYFENPANLRAENLPAPAFLLTNPVAFDHDKLALSFAWSDADNSGTEDYALKIMQEDRLIQKYFPYNTRSDTVFSGRTAFQCSFFPAATGSVLFLSRPFQPFIYRLTPDTLTEAYEIAVPKTTRAPLPGGGFSTVSFGQMSIEGITVTTARAGARGSQPFSGNSNMVTNFVDGQRFLFLNIQRGFNYNYYIFDKKEKQLYDRSKLKADSSSYQFALQGPVLAFDEKNIYQSLSARRLFGLKKGAEKLNLRYHQSLNRFYTTGKPGNNPVILRLKPKTDS
ncbi:6-bladed beta-propeller [Niabella hirudinis]|uniref:6-bladed beta-propeller n=1 Tax=Niabella hirudinis TaxID=1285929 RepID=UPI003EC09F99